MKYTIYIQAVNNFPIADWAVSAYMGFKRKQMDIIFFEDIEEVPYGKGNVVVGFIEDTNKYLNKLGLGYKKALNIPEELLSYTGRKIGYMSMGEFIETATVPIFVKPNDKAKEFVAGVITKQENIPLFMKDIPLETPVMTSEVVNFVSEYRGYVINGTLKGIKHYIGDFRIFPDMKIVDAAVADYKSAPVGYSIDFGITDDGRTLLVECNDGWSLGNYGLDDALYASLLLNRWLQLTSKL